MCIHQAAIKPVENGVQMGKKPTSLELSKGKFMSRGINGVADMVKEQMHCGINC